MNFRDDLTQTIYCNLESANIWNGNWFNSGNGTFRGMLSFRVGQDRITATGGQRGDGVVDGNLENLSFF